MKLLAMFEFEGVIHIKTTASCIVEAFDYSVSQVR